MKQILVREQVNHYHLVSYDENELDIEAIVSKALDNASRYDTGYEALEAELEYYKDKYGFEYKMKPNYAGTDCTGMEVWDEVE